MADIEKMEETLKRTFKKVTLQEKKEKFMGNEEKNVKKGK